MCASIFAKFFIRRHTLAKTSRCDSSFRDRTFQVPTRRDHLRLTQGDRRLADDTSAPSQRTLPQSDPGRLPHGFLFIIKEWGVPKALPQSLHPLGCPVKGSCRTSTPTEWVFNFLCVFLVFCGVKGFTVAEVQILPPTS